MQCSQPMSIDSAPLFSQNTTSEALCSITHSSPSSSFSSHSPLLLLSRNTLTLSEARTAKVSSFSLRILLLLKVLYGRCRLLCRNCKLYRSTCQCVNLMKIFSWEIPIIFLLEKKQQKQTHPAATVKLPSVLIHLLTLMEFL